MSTGQPRGRQPKLVILGVALVVGCAAVGAELARRGTHTEQFLELAETLPAGSAVNGSELTTASMSAPSNLMAVPAADLSDVSGARTTTALVKGSLLVVGDLTRSGQPGAGTALVGTSLQADQVPTGLVVGDAVVLVDAGSSGAGTTGSAVSSTVSAIGPTQSSSTSQQKLDVLGHGTIFSVSSGTTTGTFDVTVSVPSAIAAGVATASAQGDVSLVEVAVPPHPGSKTAGVTQ